jgi:hypothetical protein
MPSSNLRNEVFLVGFELALVGGVVRAELIHIGQGSFATESWHRHSRLYQEGGGRNNIAEGQLVI